MQAILRMKIGIAWCWRRLADASSLTFRWHKPGKSNSAADRREPFNGNVPISEATPHVNQ